MRAIIILLITSMLFGCKMTNLQYVLPVKIQKGLTGSQFFQQVNKASWRERDSLAVEAILSGHIPSFLAEFERINISMLDTVTGEKLNASYFITKDYLSIGTVKDWARIPLTPMAAQQIADKWNCFLPTRKIVDDIYTAAKVKLEPRPLTQYRDSSPTMYQHHLIIEEQRKGKKGVIAGIKKDVVISPKVTTDPRPNRVAIYGWHKLDGKPIQPLYTGHVNWYVDYSHGIRLVHQTIVVNGKAMNYKDVLKHPKYSRLLCDEPVCDHYSY